MAVDTELTPTSYIQHHLQNLTVQTGEGTFFTLHMDTLITSVFMGLLMVFLFWLATRKATAGVPGKWQAFIEILLEVRLATHPLLNSIRTFAISGVSVITATPLDEIFLTSLFTMLRMISISWIMRSRITLTSVPRGLNWASRCTSINMGFNERD